ncbi:general stress protein [Calothrix sp. UHCC 0171]|uniref:general stress protein n=1 Tax=Calothrix sp. UHCC 0171 TaxID=3110245 RepID=UPI002B1F78E3|nr:general stress protein [Calothrix sp. UHCC 0171]MEA5570283.1 general stress protein [Calothrix sp. UHCC 0171]
MVVNIHKRAVGVFSRRQDAENALHELKNSGFPMERVSVIAQEKDHRDNIAGAEVREKVGNQADEGASLGAATGGTVGGLTGLLIGLGTLAIPGIGPIMLAGATATAIATTIAGAGIGAAAGGLLGGLIGLGIPETEARSYNTRVERGDYLVIIDGTDAEIAHAEQILRLGDRKYRPIEDFAIYDQPNQVNPDYATADVYPAVVTPIAENTALGYTPGVMHQSMIRNKRAVGVFSHRSHAEAALTELRDSGFAMNNVSIIGKDTDNNFDAVSRTPMEGNKADDGAKTGAATGATLGGLGGFLVGLGALAIPGIGPVIAGGAAATALATTVTGGAIGAAAGGVVGGLVGLGIPENRARVYSDRLNRGNYIVMVDGSEEEVRHAETILRNHGIEEFDIFNATDIHSTERETPVMDTSRTNYATDISRDIDTNAPVVIIDRREEIV